MKIKNALFILALGTLIYNSFAQEQKPAAEEKTINNEYMGYLKVGDIAPDFTAKNQDGKDITLSKFKGKKVILYFYPKDDTQGCTAEACNLRDNYEDLTKKGFEVIGVSPDGEQSHTKFIAKYNLQFNLIADTAKTILKAYGAWGKKSMYGKEYEGVLRTTYIIDEKGKIEKVIDKVDTKNHSSQILTELKMN
jgi:thioredoxin-dependent peroxiredoxin